MQYNYSPTAVKTQFSNSANLAISIIPRLLTLNTVKESLVASVSASLYEEQFSPEVILYLNPQGLKRARLYFWPPENLYTCTNCYTDLAPGEIVLSYI